LGIRFRTREQTNVLGSCGSSNRRTAGKRKKKHFGQTTYGGRECNGRHDLGDDEAISKLLKKSLQANGEELVKTKLEPLSGRISGLLEESVEEGRQTLLEQRKEVGSAMDDDDDDVPICKLLQKPLKSNVEEICTKTPELLSASRSGLLEEPSEEGSIIEEFDDNVPIYKLLNKTVNSARDKSQGTKNLTEVKCAERGGSGMLLWQHEFYFVLESEELSRRQHAPPKPYLYQAIQFRRGMELPEDQKVGMTRKQLGEMWVLGVAYAPAKNIRMYSSRQKGYLFHSEFNDTVGKLKIRACWHDIVFRNEFGFTERMFLYT
jgi:hypothetical protein